MVKKKLSVEEKREIARQGIKDAAMELFYTKGFEATTTRDIVAKTGILNGSLYNRFKNKDEILISIVKDAIQDLLDGSRTILSEEKNLVLAVSFPGALQIYLASQSRSVAALLYHVHCMWASIDDYMTMNMNWSKEFLADLGTIDEDKFKLSLLALNGAVGDFVGYYTHGGTIDYKETIRTYASMVATLINMPVINIEAIVERLNSILTADDFVFMGHNLSEDLPQLSNPPEDN